MADIEVYKKSPGEFDLGQRRATKINAQSSHDVFTYDFPDTYFIFNGCGISS